MADPQSRKPLDNAFQQQRLKAWQPLLTPKWVMGTFCLVGVIFVILALVILNASNSVAETTFEYPDPAGDCEFATDPSSCAYTMSIPITENFDAPVYVYYKLTNFYQNHRRYVKSRSDIQLRNETIDGPDDISSCDPLTTDEDGRMYYPCGLIAASFFYDSWNATLIAEDGTPTPLEGSDWDKSEIAWSSDVEHKFVGREPNDDETRTGKDGVVLPRVDDPDFIVWMRTAGLPTFKKLYRVINRDLVAGDTLQLDGFNAYVVGEFGGTKSIVLSTTTWLGGKNDFLGWAYLTVGIISLVLAAIFFAKHKLSPRPLGDMRYFNFPKLPTS